jgi:hypothetical protein
MAELFFSLITSIQQRGNQMSATRHESAARRLFIITCFVTMLACPSMVAAQGLQTGVMTGVVTSADTLPLPGVTVTAVSPALQASARPLQMSMACTR